MFKKIIITCVLCLVVNSSAWAMDAMKVYKDITSDNSNLSFAGSTYIYGIVNGFTFLRIMNSKADEMTNEQFKMIYVNYCEKHPEVLQKGATTVMFYAIRDLELVNYKVFNATLEAMGN